MSKKLVIAFDFDGTLCKIYKNNQPYIPKKTIKEKPNINVVKVAKKLKKQGHKIIIYSSRWWGDYNWIKKWLDKYKIPYDDIVLGKFKADAFIDDTTVNPAFDSNWEMKLKKIFTAF